MNKVKTTPLPPHAISTDHPAHPKLHWTREELAWIAARDKQFLAYATQARADLAAENKRLRESLQKAVDQAIWPSKSISNALEEARTALKDTK